VKAAPYHQTPVYDAQTLPEAVRRAHNTKAGVWGLLQVLSGELRFVFHDPLSERMADPAHPVVIPPEAVHHVEVTGPVRMQISFYREPPLSD
jgi:tellurite resistance-related uncharacterized protein